MINHTKKTIKKNKYYILTFIFLFILNYAIQDVMHSENLGLRNVDRSKVYISLFLLIGILGMQYIYSLIEKKLKVSSTELTLWCITIWIIIVDVLRSTNLWSALVHIGLSILWIFVYSFFYYYLIKNPFSISRLMKYIMIMFIFYIFATVYAKYNIQSIYNRIAVVNMVYNVLVFLPWTTLISNRRLRNLSFFVTIIIVVISMKRGAMIVLPIMLVLYFIVEGIVKNKYISVYLKILFFALIFITIVGCIDQYSGGYITNRFSQESLSSGSGRSVIYSSILLDIKQRNIVDLLIGSGSASSLNSIGFAAHNDWLEFLYSYGIIGTILYLTLFWGFLKRSLNLIKSKSKYSAPYTMGVAYIFLIGMVGMIFFSHSTFYIMALFGTVNGLVVSEKVV